jgi:glycosyltransferase involved in cell wall biosynthesis
MPSVLVRELISPTAWHPPRLSTDPALSIIVATGPDRGSGLLATARSVLEEDSELELIVVDDTGTAAVAESMEALRREDERVGLLRHPRPLGLSALAFDEGWARARGDQVVFSFAGDEFRAGGLESLLSAQREHPDAIVYRGDTLPQVKLRGLNFLPLHGVLVPRDVRESVGLFDPHVAMAGHFEWDLWRRIGERFRFEGSTGSVGSPTRPTAVRGDHPALDEWAALEWMERPRKEALRWECIQDYDLLGPPAGLSREASAAVGEQVDAFRRRWWFPARPDPASGRRGSEPGEVGGRLLVVSPYHEASTTLCFDRLPNAYRQRTRVAYPEEHDPEEMLGASAVVFVRTIFEFLDWVEWARRLAIPRYYFLDDNLMTLGRQDQYRDSWGTFTEDRLRDLLRTFSGVLLSSRSLVEYFRDRELHPNLFYFPPISIARIPGASETPASAFRIGFLGGEHRWPQLLTIVLPAIRALAEEGPVELVVVARDAQWASLAGSLGAGPNLDVRRLPHDLSLELVLRRLAEQNLDVLVHPNSPNANNPYKTLNALLNAAALGAVPVVSAGPPYDRIRDQGIALLCGDRTEEWARAIRQVRDDSAEAARLLDRLSAFCREHFDGEANAAVLAAIFAAHPLPGRALREERLRHALWRPPVSATFPPGEGPARAKGPLIEADQPLQPPGPRRPLEGTMVFRVVPRRRWWVGCEILFHRSEGETQNDVVVDLQVRTRRGHRLRATSLRLEPVAGDQWAAFGFPVMVNSDGQELELALRLDSLVGRAAPSVYERRRGDGTDAPALYCRLLYQTAAPEENP